MKVFDEITEEAKAIKWLDEKRKDYSLNCMDLHYLNIIYYLIKNLMKEAK